MAEEPQPKNAPKPTEEDVKRTPEQDKNLDRDGGERYPSQHTDRK